MYSSWSEKAQLTVRNEASRCRLRSKGLKKVLEVATSWHWMRVQLGISLNIGCGIDLYMFSFANSGSVRALMVGLVTPPGAWRPMPYSYADAYSLIMRRVDMPILKQVWIHLSRA